MYCIVAAIQMNDFDFILKMTRAAKPMKAVAAVTQQIVMFFTSKSLKRYH